MVVGRASVIRRRNGAQFLFRERQTVIPIEGNMVVRELDKLAYAGEEWPTVVLPLCRDRHYSIGTVFDAERHDMLRTLPKGDRSGVGSDE